MSQSEDRRVKRTLESLRMAMVALIIEKGFEATSIKEISERANVGRSTFYAHFADKEDLLQGSVEQMAQHLHERILSTASAGEQDCHSALAFSLPMLEHANEGRKLFSAMVGQKSGNLFEEFCSDILRSFVREGAKGISELQAHVIVGGFFATMKWWLLKAPQKTPSEVHEAFCEFIEPSLVGFKEHKG